MLSPLERAILKKVAESQLLTKVELKNYLSQNGMKSNGTALDMAIKNLNNMDFLTTINPIGSTCLIVTKKGNQMLEDLS